MEKIAWIGLGNMGVPMVKNLSRQGIAVTAYNRTQKQADAGNARTTVGVDEAVRGADVLFVMVSDGEAVRNVLFGVDGAVPHLEKGTAVVNMSTIGVDESKQLALDLAEHGVEFMDAPVIGSVQPARSAELVVLAGGSEATFKKLEPLLLTMSRSALYLGPVGSGAAMKLLVNAYLGSVVETAAECMALGEKSGLGKGAFLEVLSETGMWSPILGAKQGMWQTGDYQAAFALKHMTKDLGLMTRYATQLSASVPSLFAVFSAYLAALGNDLAELDMAAVYQQAARTAGTV